MKVKSWNLKMMVWFGSDDFRFPGVCFLRWTMLIFRGCTFLLAIVFKSCGSWICNFLRSSTRVNGRQRNWDVWWGTPLLVRYTYTSTSSASPRRVFESSNKKDVWWFQPTSDTVGLLPPKWWELIILILWRSRMLATLEEWRLIGYTLFTPEGEHGWRVGMVFFKVCFFLNVGPTGSKHQ